MSADEFSGPNGEDGRVGDSDDLNENAPGIARLMRRAAEGNRWAWERLVEQYERLIWAMTRDLKQKAVLPKIGKGPLTWEPPIGIEPMTYSLRVSPYA